jgi:4-aminobutyrate aminotransferase-like enzyme
MVRSLDEAWRRGWGTRRAGRLGTMSGTPTLPPELVTAVPGPRSRALAKRLAEVESRDTTCLVPEPPIFWERAAGANVWDVDGNRYVDLGGAFGVANVGHAHPRVVGAVRKQSGELLHAMGDVHPPTVKVALLEALVARFPGAGSARAVLGSSGADAVEAALQTALLATGRAGVVAFEGGYHGLSLGALDATWRSDFRAPFAARLPHRTVFARFGDADGVLEIARGADAPIGAVLVEPIQGRGGIRVPPAGFLARLRALCDREGWLLICDEVYTGFGRTGRWFACEHEDVVPDLLCVAKGLASGMPISACMGRASVMDAWPPSRGEALHTQTFLGHPPACAAALASLEVLAEEKLVERAASTGAAALAFLEREVTKLQEVAEVRGRGLMLGIECRDSEYAHGAVARALERGLILLPSGEAGRVLTVTPPLSVEPDVLLEALGTLLSCLS